MSHDSKLTLTLDILLTNILLRFCEQTWQQKYLSKIIGECHL